MPAIIPRIVTTPVIPIVAIMMPMIIVSEIMMVISPIRMIESIVSPRTHPRMIVIIIPIIIVVIDSKFSTFFEIDIQIAIFGDMRGEIGIVETTNTFTILEFLVFFCTDGNRVCRTDNDVFCFGTGSSATAIIFIHIARRKGFCFSLLYLQNHLFLKFILIDIFLGRFGMIIGIIVRLSLKTEYRQAGDDRP